MFSLFNRAKKIEHPTFGRLLYRKNRLANKKSLPGFWEGLLDYGQTQPLQLLIWADKHENPHPKQIELFEAILPKLEAYIEASKEGLFEYIKKEETKANAEMEYEAGEVPPVFNLEHMKVSWELQQLYFQAYPMSARLKEDLDSSLHDALAWGFCFNVSGAYDNETTFAAYSAYVDLEFHPKFPFTYHEL